MRTARAVVDQHFPQAWCCPCDGGPGVGGPAAHPQTPILLTAWCLPVQVVLRVLFPDRHILQGFFRPRETGVGPRLGVQEGGAPPSGCRAPGRSGSQVAIVPGGPAAGPELTGRVAVAHRASLAVSVVLGALRTCLFLHGRGEGRWREGGPSLPTPSSGVSGLRLWPAWPPPILSGVRLRCCGKDRAGASLRVGAASDA